MNIGIFTDTYYPNTDNIATSVMLLKQELTKQGHKVYIFTTVQPKPIPGELKVFRIPNAPNFFMKDTNSMAYFYPDNILKKIKKLKLDIVHTITEFSLGYLGKRVSMAFNTPWVHAHYEMDYRENLSNGKELTDTEIKRLTRVFCNHADVVISTTEPSDLKAIGVKRPIRYNLPVEDVYEEAILRRG